jgi:hypothetical protein
MAKAKKVDVTVMVGDAHVDKIDEVKQKLEEAGLDVREVLGSIGAITGSAAPKSLAGLRKVRGVSAVESSEEYQLPPPDSDVQ